MTTVKPQTPQSSTDVLGLNSFGRRTFLYEAHRESTRVRTQKHCQLAPRETNCIHAQERCAFGNDNGKTSLGHSQHSAHRAKELEGDS